MTFAVIDKRIFPSIRSIVWISIFLVPVFLSVSFYAKKHACYEMARGILVSDRILIDVVGVVDRVKIIDLRYRSTEGYVDEVIYKYLVYGRRERGSGSLAIKGDCESGEIDYNLNIN